MGSRVVLLLAVGAAVALASTAVMYHCEPPMDARACMAAFIACSPVDAANCSAAGGHVVANGGVCNVCDICVTTVGWGQPCNYTTDVGGPVMTLCSASLVCIRRFNGTCRHPQECL